MEIKSSHPFDYDMTENTPEKDPTEGVCKNCQSWEPELGYCKDRVEHYDAFSTCGMYREK